MGRILGIDLGIKRIGLAISDELLVTAQGLEVYEIKNKKSFFSYLKNLIKKYNINKIVVGLPLNKTGEITKSSWVLGFITTLIKKINLPVETWDERFTSLEAEKVLLQADTSRKKRKEIIDKVSAQLILQSYLEKIKYQNEAKDV